MWKIFLSKWNGRSFFLESTPTPAQNLELYTDAAGSIGFGGYFQGKWFQGCCPPNMQLNQQQGISIEWPELFPIVVACAIWHQLLARKCLQFWCDNLSVVSIINSGHSKTPRIMDLVRHLVLLSMQHNFVVQARHVPWVTNAIADALSRFQMQRFRFLAPRRRPESLYHPAFAHDPLREEVLQYATWGLAENTNRARSSGEKRFLQFCLMNRIFSLDGDVLPASEGTLIYFASYLARTVRHNTIKLYLAAVRNLHVTAGYPDPLKGKLLLRKVLRDILRYQGNQRTRRLPVTPEVLLATRPVLQSWLCSRDFSMIWATFNLAFLLSCAVANLPTAGCANFVNNSIFLLIA